MTSLSDITIMCSSSAGDESMMNVMKQKPSKDKLTNDDAVSEYKCAQNRGTRISVRVLAGKLRRRYGVPPYGEDKN
jgi:hypothetical protein